jgi:hypothetical protein
MNRYAITVTIGISAKTEAEAKRIMKEIVESGTANGSEPGKIAQARLNTDPIAIKLPF